MPREGNITRAVKSTKCYCKSCDSNIPKGTHALVSHGRKETHFTCYGCLLVATAEVEHAQAQAG